MKHSVRHGLGKEGAKRAVVAAFSSYAERFAKYQPVATWTSDDRAEVSFSAKGITLGGSLVIGENTIDLDLDVPFLLRPFKDKAVSAVEKEIGAWVDKAKRGEI
jgi:hypothetical protein